MSRIAPIVPIASIAPVARSSTARRSQPVAAGLSALVLTIAAGCTQLQLPPPNAPAARLPETHGAPDMTDAQKQNLTRLNQRIYDEQETAIERERAQRAIDNALRSYGSSAYFYGGWGGAAGYGPGWYGPGWYGPGGYGGYGGYGPHSSIGIGVGF